MIIVSLLLMSCIDSQSIDAQQSYVALINQFDQNIEWIDARGSRKISGAEARSHLIRLTKKLTQPHYEVRHESSWKNQKSYKIILVRSQKEGFRVFFQCIKRKRGVIVDKVKLDLI